MVVPPKVYLQIVTDFESINQPVSLIKVIPVKSVVKKKML